MSRFNTPAPTTKTVNLAGGQAYKQSPELELISVLLTSFANEQFYRSSNDGFENLKQVIAKCDKKFAAKAAIYARNEFGMRSITHVAASLLAEHISGQPWAKSFFEKIIRRPDDMMEILSFHSSKVPNSMKKGFALAFEKFDTYQLAKYKGEGKKFKLIDVVNLVHPVPVEKNAEALSALVKNDLKSFGTWESELTKAGQEATNEDEKAEFKKEVWTKLIQEKKISYFALLRNLRNIVTQAPEVFPDALAILETEYLIKKSLVLPFRFLTAYDVMKELGLNTGKALVSLNKAVDISLSNVPKFDGSTLVVLDVSGSMSGKPAEIGSLFSAVLLKTNECDFMKFADDARYENVNTMDSTISIASSVRFSSGGTNFHSIFKRANKAYDRIIILSDMQGWMGVNLPASAFEEYKQRTKCDPYIYSFDLNNYGNMQFPEKKVFCIAGFSDKIFNIMSLLEKDKNALKNTIDQVEI